MANMVTILTNGAVRIQVMSTALGPYATKEQGFAVVISG